MPLPSINITFKTVGISAIQRSQKGIVALILKDTEAMGAHTLTNITEIPDKLSQENKDYIKRAFIGYINPPRSVLVYVIGAEQMQDDALKHFATLPFDYLAGPLDITSEEAEEIALWVKTERENDHMVKAVLPNIKADSEAIVNFTTENIQVGSNTYTAAQYCSRIAGLIAGTPMTISCTYATLPEVTDVERKPKVELDKAVDNGEFVLFHDGEKVKVGRGVNSLTTTIEGKGKEFQKIKVVEAMDMIRNDIRITAQDNYIGKYSNSYDNRCLLIVAIKGYLEELERGGILETGRSSVSLDLAKQETYLKKQGIDTDVMNEQQIKEANTGSIVFLQGSIKILDAIEDIELDLTI